LTGTIPDWIGSKGALTTLGLGNNLFTGDVPSSIANLDKLRILGLDDNALGGNIEIFKPLTKLQSLYLEDNFFRGELTSQMMSFWDQLEELDLSNNDLTSQLPSNMFNSDKLQVIDLNGNRMIGTLPNVPSKNTALQFLSLWNNTLTGAIPASLENLEGLQHLDISLNYFSSYPDSLQQMTALKYFFMGSNEFTEAPFPQSILQLSNLEELSLKDCKLTGAIPSAIGQLTKLRLLE
jgi:Leucine-rich repeat (LRR) protein